MVDSLVKKKKRGVVDPTQGVLGLPVETISEVSANETVASETPKTEEGVEVAESASPQESEPSEGAPSDSVDSSESAPVEKKTKKLKKKKKKGKWKSPPFASLLCERFPALFNLDDRKPLKCGVGKEIAEILKDDPEFDQEELDKALRWYTSGQSYLLNMVKRYRRFDLEGNKAEKIEENHKQSARHQLDLLGVVIYEKKTKEKKPNEKASDTADLPKDETAEISVPENPAADLNAEQVA